MAIEVELRLLAKMRRLLPEADRDTGKVRLAAPEGVTLSGFLGLAGIDTGMALVVLLNGRHAVNDTQLKQGDVVSVFPPVAGG